MTTNVFRTTYIVILASLTGCASLAPLLSQPTPAPVAQATATPQLITAFTQTAPPAVEAHVLRIWLPPRFDPNADTVFAKLLKQRLVNFEALHRGLQIEVRVKAEQGETGLLNALSITSNAAPSALPDLIALTHPDLETAALKGLLHPIDGLSTILHDPNWYAYARELGNIQNIGYGLPFAGDALVLVHRLRLDLQTWDDIFSSKENLIFTAGDPQGLSTLSLYISAGGNLVNEQGLPILEEEPLTQTLTLIQSGYEAKTIPPFVLDLKTDEQTIQAYRDERANMVITWAAQAPGNAEDIIEPVPNLGATPHTFANGWIWALAGSTSENQQVATELAEYLIADEFINAWLPEAGYLPTRHSQDKKMNAILESAETLPSNDVLLVLGPIMNQALSRVLNGDPVVVVVRSVMEQFK